MESLKKLSQALSLAGGKKDELHSAMGLLMLEWQDAGGHLKLSQNLYRGCSDELDSKEKHLRVVEESVNKRVEEFGSERRLVEAGLMKLDQKEMYLKGVLREIELGKMQFEQMRGSLDEQLKDLVLREQPILGALKLKQSRVSERELELDLMAKALSRREDESDLKEKNLKLREDKVIATERLLERRQKEIDSEEKKLERRSNEVVSNQKGLAERSFRIDSMEKHLEARANVLGSEAERMNRRENEINSRDQLLAKLTKQLETRENEIKLRVEKLVNILQELEANEGTLGSSSKFELLSIKNFFHQCPGEAEVRRVGRKRDYPADQDKNLQENSNKHGKGSSCIRHRRMGQIEAPGLQNSGTHCMSQAHITEEVNIRRDDYEPESDSMAKLNFDPVKDPSFTSVKNGKQERTFNVGEIWACFDAKDFTPRSHAEITGIVHEGGETRLEVTWLKPCSMKKLEQEWIRAGLPVTCGTFVRGRTSVESSVIFSHVAVCAENFPADIMPCEGETWAIYKDWNIITWTSDAEILKGCHYDIVEILPCDRNERWAVRVVYLERIAGSARSFKRRSNKGRNKNIDGSFHILPDSFYRFSHKVPSIKSDGNGVSNSIFELDVKCLPRRLQ
ncbi:OLC1v1023126C1 [Oldenlandia corymbosa var. corymbosa]|uniref:OLC1v1023126C1 n=1 Tax=Oldenlandia corymbosa var. corymbosa TaxID=529605 RepID=A0AAV1CGK6_OLDCO|nr:OLC1v1023126C1 [Oldenlandia corymbosa var. corymbosa]